jgi:hypothetical protein
MVDALATEYILLSRAGRLLSTRPSAATLWRWATRGVGGVRLETYKIGGRRYTTAEALERFVACLSNPSAASVPTAPSRRDREHKDRAAARAESIYGR